jgi:hypothetical protein
LAVKVEGNGSRSVGGGQEYVIIGRFRKSRKPFVGPELETLGENGSAVVDRNDDGDAWGTILRLFHDHSR